MLIRLHDLGSGVLGYQGAQGSQGHQGVPTNTDCYWFCLFCELQYPCFALLYLSFEAAVSAFLTDVSKFGTAVYNPFVELLCRFCWQLFQVLGYIPVGG